MKKIILFVACFGMTHLTTVSSVNAQCYSGGPNSSSCSYTESILFGLYTITHSVSCQAGSYACCNSNSGSCIKNGQKPPMKK
jgi:hypothetical protein